MPPSDGSTLTPLVSLTKRRWAVACLGVLSAEDGARFVRLCRVLDQSPMAIRAALDHLCEMDLVMRNPGYGHPLRPEYILTETGAEVGEAARQVWEMAQALAAPPVVWRKWTGPVLVAAHEPAEFGRLRSMLTPITDRALSAALRDAQAAGWLTRNPVRGFPPSVLYVRERAGDLISLGFSAVNEAVRRASGR